MFGGLKKFKNQNMFSKKEKILINEEIDSVEEIYMEEIGTF